MATSSSTSMADIVKIEMEAAEALAGLAHFPPNSPSISERIEHEPNDANSSSFSRNSYQDATNFTLKKSEKSGISTSKLAKDEHIPDRKLNPPTNCASSGRKSRQNLTEAEMEARKIRRVLANRESARQTIHRRQAIFEELTRKAVDLAWENEKLKREKNTASKQYGSLKTKNGCLKAEMIKAMNVEAGEEDSNATNEPTVSASSTNSPFIIYNQQPPFLPFVWPNSVQLQCGGIVFPSRIPDSSSCEEGNSIGAAAGPVYLLPYPWLVTTSLPQTQSGGSGGGGVNERPHHGHGHGRRHSFNLNDKPKESSSEWQQLYPEKVTREGSAPSNDSHGREGFPPDGGGGGQSTGANSKVAMAPVSRDDTDNDTDNNNNNSMKEDVKGSSSSRVGDSEQIPVMWSAGKRVGDTAAAEARKRRKQLTRLKNNFQYCRQPRIMH